MATQTHLLLSSTFTSRRSLQTPPPSPPPPPKQPKPSITCAARLSGRSLRVAVIGGGPAGSSAAAALAAGGVETYLIERSPAGAKPCGGAIPLCMLEEFDIPSALVDRSVRKMRIISPSNLTVDFGSKTLKPHEHIPMLRREVLDSFLRSRAQSNGANLISALVTRLDVPSDDDDPYVVTYISGNTKHTLPVDVVVGADGANSRVARAIGAGEYSCAIAFQERIRLPECEMEAYEDLAEMYVGSDVSPDFYGWVFPKCDHVAVGTGTASAKSKIKLFQSGIKKRVRDKIRGGVVIKVEAHPIPEHPRPRRVVGRAALVGDAAGYVTKCAGEGIYFAAKSGRMCGEAIVRASDGGREMVGEEELKMGYLKEWDEMYRGMFRFMDGLQRVFYGSDWGREALVEMCGDEYVQRMTFESYLYKKMVRGSGWEDLRMGWNTLGSLVRARIIEGV